MSAAVERWLGEGGADMQRNRQFRRRGSEGSPGPTPKENKRRRAADRSMSNIDQNATQEASDAQSASDAVDREAESPADEGGEA